MREFNQASLDARLAEIAPNLSPEQAAQVKERVRERVSAGGIDASPDAIDGAFHLIGGLLSGAIPAPNLGGLGERLTGTLAAFDPRRLGSAGIVGDLPSQAGGVLAGLGRALGSMPDLAGSLFGKGAEIAGTAAGAAGSIGDVAGNAAGALGALGDLVDAGDLAGIVLEALGDVLGSLGN